MADSSCQTKARRRARDPARPPNRPPRRPYGQARLRRGAAPRARATP